MTKARGVHRLDVLLEVGEQRIEFGRHKIGQQVIDPFARLGGGDQDGASQRAGDAMFEAGEWLRSLEALGAQPAEPVPLPPSP